MQINRREVLAGIMTTGTVTGASASGGDGRSAMEHIRALDYTIIFARDMDAMKKFYLEVMKFRIYKQLGDSWLEFALGANTFVLTPAPAGGMIKEPIPAQGVSSVQLAFRVPKEAVSECEDELKQAGVPILSKTTDQSWGHRTLFFKDPDNNIIEIYAEI